MIRTLTTTLLAAGCIALLVATGAAQKTTRVHDGRGGSPHDRTEWTIDGANISITYGRPSVTGREIFGGLQPFGKVWRTGADEATVLSTSKTLVLGGLTVPAGDHTLWTLVDEKGPWKLIVNKETGQWGTAYKEAMDLGRTDMKVESLPDVVEQLTISIDDTPEGGVLRVEWAKTRASVAFTVK